MEQLSLGERSRILQKRLKGSQSTIFETYLEQKLGFRILWTQEGTSIVVWFVAKHKDVSCLMRMIDDCKSRTARQQISQSLISDLQNENLVHQVTTQNNGVLLDVFGNVPLKLYEVKFHSISDIANDSWTPKLYLTDEERDVVEAKGTVLVLGRSGTGKMSLYNNLILEAMSLLIFLIHFYHIFVRLYAYVIASSMTDRGTDKIQLFLSSLLLGQRGYVNMCQKQQASMNEATFRHLMR